MIERKIIIGLITSTDYLKQIRHVWDLQLIESTSAKRLASWCWEYFEKYDKAPNKDIEGIYYSKLKSGKITTEIGEEIEKDLLPGLSKEFAKKQKDFNLDYLISETQTYFQERHLSIYSDNIAALVSNGELLEAEKLACEYKPILTGKTEDLDLSSGASLDRIQKAFDTSYDCLIKFPRQLGEFWNAQLVRGGFVALMAPEKRGKTFWLLEFAIQACNQGRKVAFFQAGDMTEGQQLKRTSVYLAGKSDQARYCKKHWEPIRDCIKNQTNDCSNKDRECDFGVFEGIDVYDIKNKHMLEDLIKAYEDNPEYKTCTNCKEYYHESSYWGAVWLKKIPEKQPLTAKEAKKIHYNFFMRKKKHFKLSTHASDTLSLKQIRALLSIWEKQDDFVPDVIIVDYADLLIAEGIQEERQKQNQVWKGLRRLSQEKGQPLVITATQADANSYEKNRLSLKNFSEDKRKYAHVTAMWGLNQDPNAREKKIGIMRINEIVIREADFANANQIYVLQNLRRGRPFLASFR